MREVRSGWGPSGLLLLSVALLLAVGHLGGALSLEPDGANGRLLVGFKEDAKLPGPGNGKGKGAENMSENAKSVLAAVGVKKLTLTKFGKLGVVETEDGTDVEDVKAELEKSKDLEFVELDSQVAAADFIPNDTHWSKLWGMPKIGAPAAWDVTTGSRDVVVCVIDSGVDYMHPDLSANMWVNPGETGLDANGNDKRTNEVDDDGNGYVDDVYGINAIEADGNPGDPMDDNNHGTHCAGTIGGVGHNGVGVAGVNHEVSIMACKFLSASGSGWTSDGVECLDYALVMGAHVTSNSWGGGGMSNSMSQMLDAAQAAGQLFVAAAGNSNVDNDVSPHYPSSYPQDIVLSVASTTSSDGRSGFSQWGLESVDLGAPGSSIYSTLPVTAEGVPQYAYFSGTSMATPHVAGAAALLKAFNSALTGLEIKSLLMSTVDPIPALSVSGATPVVTGGRLNVASALSAAPSPSTPPPTTIPPTDPPTDPPTPLPTTTPPTDPPTDPPTPNPTTTPPTDPPTDPPTPLPTTTPPTDPPTDPPTPNPTTTPPTDPPTDPPTPPPTTQPPTCLDIGERGCNDSACCSDLVCQRFGSKKNKFWECVKPSSCGISASSCSANSECCSGNCKGPRGRKTCN